MLNAKSTSTDAIMTMKSTSPMPIDVNGDTREHRPGIRAMLVFFLMAAAMDVASSGREVPQAINVSEMNESLTRSYSIDEEPSLTPSQNASARMLMRIYFSKFFNSLDRMV